jgi:hypothetical protein
VEDQSKTKTFEGNILERIRQRPPMFLGKHSLSALSHFILGYSLGQGELGVEPPPLIPRDFHDWVAYRLHFYGATSGYADMILKRTPDEAEALARFFALLDEHSGRKANTVATVREQKLRDGFPPTTYSLVVYTDDPGFFVVAVAPGRISCDNDRFFPSLTSLLGRQWKDKAEFLTVLDQSTLDRLIREDEELEKTEEEGR